MHSHTLTYMDILSLSITLFSLLGSVKKQFFFLIKKAKHIRKKKNANLVLSINKIKSSWPAPMLDLISCYYLIRTPIYK